MLRIQQNPQKTKTQAFLQYNYILLAAPKIQKVEKER